MSSFVHKEIILGRFNIIDSAVGWPAFATHDEKLYESTLNKCVRHLEGRYGLRRFLRDGYRTECEDPTKRHYEEEETYKFQGIENQFPAPCP
uniref:Phosphorylase b kinase regulatory subunit n=1 Tax=Ditylenchus dipsaci TaxID=166011 RepID=A0A915E5Z1_9BILA